MCVRCCAAAPELNQTQQADNTKRVGTLHVCLHGPLHATGRNQLSYYGGKVVGRWDTPAGLEAK